MQCVGMALSEASLSPAHWTKVQLHRSTLIHIFGAGRHSGAPSDRKTPRSIFDFTLRYERRSRPFSDASRMKLEPNGPGKLQPASPSEGGSFFIKSRRLLEIRRGDVRLVST